jgi:hypothetical protein
MNKNTSMEFKKEHMCVCCGENLIKECHEICLICGWEDDEVQNSDPDFFGGANKRSLNEHKKYFNEMREKNKNYKWCNTWK